MKLRYTVNERENIVYTETTIVKNIERANTKIFDLRIKNKEYGFDYYTNFIIYGDNRKIIATYKH
jgi:hypothetical protein